MTNNVVIIQCREFLWFPLCNSTLGAQKTFFDARLGFFGSCTYRFNFRVYVVAKQF